MNRAIPARRAEFVARAASAFEHHVATKLSDGRWRCAKRGSWNHGFYVLFLPGTIIVYGDIGDAIFEFHDADSIGWAVRCINDLDYVVRKLVHSMERDEFVPRRAVEVLAEHRARISDACFSREERSEERANLRQMIEAARHDEISTTESFISMFYAMTSDPDAPLVEDFSANALWCYHGLRWLVTTVGEELRS